MLCRLGLHKYERDWDLIRVMFESVPDGAQVDVKRCRRCWHISARAQWSMEDE